MLNSINFIFRLKIPPSPSCPRQCDDDNRSWYRRCNNIVWIYVDTLHTVTRDYI